MNALIERYGKLLTGSYDCVDRIVLNGYFSMGHSPGGFRVWWRRWHQGSDEELDNTHLMRLAGRFARRVRSVDLHQLCLLRAGSGREESSGFRYCYSVYQVEHSRNLIFEVGGEMDRVFNAMVERTRSRLDVPKLRLCSASNTVPGNGVAVSFRLNRQLRSRHLGGT